CLFFFSGRRRHTRSKRDWSSDVCSSDLGVFDFITHALTIYIQKRPRILSESVFMISLSVDEGQHQFLLYNGKLPDALLPSDDLQDRKSVVPLHISRLRMDSVYGSDSLLVDQSVKAHLLLK